MKKGLKIIIGVVGFLVIAALAFYFWQYLQQKQEENLGYVQFNSFAKQETNGEVYFENKEAGLKFKVPTGWNYYESHIASLALSSPDFLDFKETDSTRSFIPKTGCWIGVSVKKEIENTKYDITYTSTKHRIEGDYLVNTEKDIYKKITIDNHKALFTNHLSDTNKDNAGNFLSVELVWKNRIYSLETNLFGQDKEKCSQSFDQFLSTISIK